ncbi:hypothetical protein B0H13DRAFT_2511661 [Mycena leptocephala]|nr:hypothetical protein B0H13DRAFT_2511661 [Mycena leptocephala]
MPLLIVGEDFEAILRFLSRTDGTAYGWPRDPHVSQAPRESLWKANRRITDVSSTRDVPAPKACKVDASRDCPRVLDLFKIFSEYEAVRSTAQHLDYAVEYLGPAIVLAALINPGTNPGPSELWQSGRLQSPPALEQDASYNALTGLTLNILIAAVAENLKGLWGNVTSNSYIRIISVERVNGLEDLQLRKTGMSTGKSATLIWGSRDRLDSEFTIISVKLL